MYAHISTDIANNNNIGSDFIWSKPATFALNSNNNKKIIKKNSQSH